jgi:hypothetical protein
MKPKATPANDKTKSQSQPEPKQPGIRPDFFQELYEGAGKPRHPLGAGIPKNHPLVNHRR